MKRKPKLRSSLPPASKKTKENKEQPLPPPENTQGFNWIYCLLGLAAGYVGSKFWYNHHPLWLKGLPFQALSAWWIWKAFPSKLPLIPETSSSIPPLPAPKKQGKEKTAEGPTLPLGQPGSWNSILLLLGSALLAALGQYFFYKHKINPGLISWVLGISLFLYQQNRSTSPFEPFRFRSEKTLLFLVLLVAALMRFPFVGEHLTGLQVDEASCVQDGMEFASGKLQSPFVTTAWGANASFHFWWLGQFMKVFGSTWQSARAFSAVVSIAAILAFYLWSRLFFGRWASLAASFLMSVGWWFLFYSLSPFQDILVALWEILAFYFMARALKEGRKMDYVWTGLFIALCEMEYLPGRLVGFALAVALLGILFVEGKSFWKAHAKWLPLSFLSALWLSAPFIRYFIANYDYCMGRTHNLSLLDEVQRTGHYGLILKKWAWTFMSFIHQNPAADMRFSALGPMIDWVCGALMVFGFVLVLTHPKKRVSWFILCGFVFAMAANALAIQGPNPDPTYVNGQRYFIVVPFIFLMVAWSLDWFFGYLSGLTSRARTLGTLVLVLLAGYATFWNSKIYYRTFQDFKVYGSYWGDLGFNHVQVADFLKANCPRCHAIVDWEYNSTSVQVLTDGLFSYYSLSDPLNVPIDKKISKNVMLLTLRWNFTEIQEKIKKYYPRAVWGTLDNPNGSHDIVTVEISKEDIEALQKGIRLNGELP